MLGCWQGTEDKAAVIGIDIGKDSFHVVDLNRSSVIEQEVSFWLQATILWRQITNIDR
jgi:Tfp pilus assembly PilM family ATPase